MRVLLTTDTIGGVWTFTKELASGLLEQGHAVALVSFGRQPSAEQAGWCGRVARRYTGHFESHASAVGLEWMTENREVYEDGGRFLLEVAHAFRPDLLHTNQFCFGCLPVGVPVVVTAHSDVVGWGAVCRPEGLLPSPWLTQYGALVARGLRAAHAIVAPTRWMLSTLEKHYGRVSGHVIPNGRSVTYSTAQERKLQAVSVGRFWDDAKNLDLLTKVRSTVPILVAGENEFDGVLRAPQPGSIRSLGHLGEESLHALFGESSLYLAPSIYEPFGLAPLEAALCGCGVVANDLPSFREVWGDGALYFHDATELTTLLERLAGRPDLLAQLQQRSTERALRYSGRRMTNSYLALYDSLVGVSARPEYATHVA